MMFFLFSCNRIFLPVDEVDMTVAQVWKTILPPRLLCMEVHCTWKIGILTFFSLKFLVKRSIFSAGETVAKLFAENWISRSHEKESDMEKGEGEKPKDHAGVPVVNKGANFKFSHLAPCASGQCTQQ